jgi:acetylornithine deacetylase/succinyl-diaminopimelate desuccinylase-like protein
VTSPISQPYDAVVPDDPTAEVTDLLQHLIRNACVNDGTPESGFEGRSVDVLRAYLDVPGLDLQTFALRPDRPSLVARIEGRDPSAPSLLLMGHTDVVPANPDGWRHDPYGGELIDGEVWGRGAVDMLNLTASMAVATKQLAGDGFRPEGTLIYLAVSDEEALGTYGAKYLTEAEGDAVRADYVVTESGGFPMDSPSGTKRPVVVGEKGSFWCTLRISGTPGHASTPFRTDNALVKAAEVVRRIDAFVPETRMHDIWRRFVEGVGWGPELSAALLDAEHFTELCHGLPVGLARQAHACTHTTLAPTVMHAGTKTNVIPDRVELDIDIRTLPGQTGEEVRALLDSIIGPDLAPSVELIRANDDPSTASPIDTPLWDALQRVTDKVAPGSTNIPFLTVGATDARFFRRAGATAYGFGLFSPRITFEEFGAMFHGDDERVDQDSLRLSTELWAALATDFLS